MIVDWLRLRVLAGMVASSAGSLRRGLEAERAGKRSDAYREYERAESRLTFALALAQYLTSRRCLTR